MVNFSILFDPDTDKQRTGSCGARSANRLFWESIWL